MTPGPRDTRFSGFFDFAVCGGVYVGLAVFSAILLRQNYRCVPKSEFSADIFLSFSFMFFRSVVVYLKLGSRLTFLLTCGLSRRSEKGRKEGGSGLLLKV